MSEPTMTGLWLEDGEVRVRDDLPVPDPPPGEARVRVLRAGVCATDLELVRGYYPYRGVLGHEFVGVVEEVELPAGDRAGPGPGGTVGATRGADARDDSGRTAPERDPRELIGRRVVGEINAVCGRCRPCRAGRPDHCANRSVLGIMGRDGAFAEQLTLPVENLHPVPEGVTTDEAVFTEPLAAALEIQQQVPVRPGDRVVVVGDGRLGQLVARSLALTGCDLTVVGRHRRKLELLRAEGIRTIRAPRPDGDTSGGGSGRSAEAGSLPDGLEPRAHDLAVDCTGAPSGFGIARRALRPRGTLVMKSTYAGELSLDASAAVVDELTLVGSRCGPFPPALRLLEDRRIDPLPLVDDRFPLAEADAALRRAGERGVLKVVLEA